MDRDKLAYTINEACVASGLGRTLLYQLLTNGEIESFHVGTRRLIPRESLEAFIKARMAQAGPPTNGRSRRHRSSRAEATAVA